MWLSTEDKIVHVYCFTYSCKDGYETYTKWKYDWSTNGQREASIKVYVSERIMPFWVQCTLCSKWREFPEKQLTTNVIKTWKCTSSVGAMKSKTKVTIAVILCNERYNYFARHID